MTKPWITIGNVSGSPVVYQNWRWWHHVKITGAIFAGDDRPGTNMAPM